MNMKKTAMLAVAASALAMTGCVMTGKNDGGDACLKPDIAKDIVHEKYAVEKDAITVTETLSFLRLGPWSITWGGTATHVAEGAPVGGVSIFGMTLHQKALNGAFANACDQAGCDSLVGARYNYMVEDYWIFGKVTCEAKGYPAKLTGVELIENKSIGK